MGLFGRTAGTTGAEGVVESDIVSFVVGVRVQGEGF